MENYIGRRLGRYEVTEQLGEGGMATVYKAFDARLNRFVAVKVILPVQQDRAQFLARFDREARSLAQLSHPNIVKVLDYGEEQGTTYLVMEYLPGGTLKDKLGQPMEWQQAARLLVPIARALEYAHQRNLVHRDVKPANILLTESAQPMLSDFGIAKLLTGDETQLTRTGVGIGTPAYMAPEQGKGEVDHRSDIYSLGIVFYEMITGSQPYRADTPMAVIIKHMNEPLPSPRKFVSDLPEVVERVLYKALAKLPEERFQDMGAFADALEVLALGSGENKFKDLSVSVGKSSKKVLYIVLIAVVGLLLLCCILPWLLYVLDICLPSGPWPSFPWCNVHIPEEHNRFICPPPGPWIQPPWCLGG